MIQRVTDVSFATDIIINFRTAYFNSKTGKLVTNGKRIACNYACNGRFWIDIIASLPVEIISLFSTNSQSNLRLIGLLKLVRLLRLGRMISYLKANQRLKLTMKIGQLLFFVLLIIHWTNCLWRYVTIRKEEWYPPKDLDLKYTQAYDDNDFTMYWIFYYYGVLTLVNNELIPTTYSEIVVAIVLVFLGTIFIGVVIGEFTALLSSMTK